MDESIIERQVRERFADGAIQQVKLLRYGDDPSVEPGQVILRLIVDSSKPSDGGSDALAAFHGANDEAIRKLAKDLPSLAPGLARLEISDGDKFFFIIGTGEEKPGDLTPVMARLGQTDLETLDTLIRAGMATSRAEAVRWALARIRERPAYAQLNERIREIDDLKAQ